MGNSQGFAGGQVTDGANLASMENFELPFWRQIVNCNRDGIPFFIMEDYGTAPLPGLAAGASDQPADRRSVRPDLFGGQPPHFDF
jgi:hypothetical protein